MMLLRPSSGSMSSEELVATRVQFELQSLLLYAIRRIGPGTASRIRVLIGNGFDWEALVRMATRHAVTPQLFSNLLAACPDALPEAIRDRFRADFEYNAQFNLMRTSELLWLLRLFEISGITAIPWKGPVLAALAYGNLALRQFVDLDILIPAQHLPEARRLMMSQGYVPDLRVAPSQEAALVRNRYELLFTHPEDGRIIELQWAITPRYFAVALDLDGLWRRAERVSLGGAVVASLAPEDLLLVLCVHGAKHLWERLGWICDITELVRARPDLDWEDTFREARRVGAERILLLGLRLAGDLLEAPIPLEVAQRTQSDASLTPLVAQVRANLFLEPAPTPGILETALFHLGARERWRDRLMYVLRFATSPNIEDWTLVQLPAGLSFLYLPLRAARLAAKYGLRGGR
jgi:hypothetical protein